MTVALTNGWFCDRSPGRQFFNWNLTAKNGLYTGGGLIGHMTINVGIQFWGLWYLVGQTVSAQIGGLDCGDYTVAADGSVTVPFGSDTGGLFVQSYIVSLSASTSATVQTALINYSTNLHYYVPVVIGRKYTTQGQRLRPATADDIKSPIGAALGKVRRTEIAAFLLSNTIGISAGTDFSNLEALVLPGTDGETALPATSLFSGVVRLNLTDNHTYDSMLCWQVNRPWPCTICATSQFLHTEEE